MPSEDQTKVEIQPEPSPVERAAILAALEAAFALDTDARPGAWWQAGLRDGGEEEG